MISAAFSFAEYRSLLQKGIDSIAAKAVATEARVSRRTFGQCATELIKSKKSGWRGETHAAQWRSTIDQYCAPILDKFVEVTTAEVLAIPTPLWARLPATASRLRGRIEAILDFAKVHGLRSGENPASWRGHLALILPKRGKLTHSHHAAMDYRDVPAFVAGLRSVESVAARALEFTILTAMRSGEVRFARWPEIDMDAKVWTIPPEHTNTAAEHRVPLSARAIEILEELAAHRHGDLVFPGQRRNQPIGKTSMSALAGGVTVHGMRSSFRDWAGNESLAPREVAEAALAHSVGNAVEQAYWRGDALEKRRVLMDAWSQYIRPIQGDNVVPLRA